MEAIPHYKIATEYIHVRAPHAEAKSVEVRHGVDLAEQAILLL